VTSCIVDSAAIYIMVVIIWNTSWPPPPQLSLPRRAALTTNSNGTQSAHKGKGWGRSRNYSHVYESMVLCRVHIFLFILSSYIGKIFKFNSLWLLVMVFSAEITMPKHMLLLKKKKNREVVARWVSPLADIRLPRRSSGFDPGLPPQSAEGRQDSWLCITK
jgi:hypothetical protein